MTAHLDLAPSLLRARARRDVARTLETLSKEDARAVLLDLYAEYQIEIEEAAEAEAEEEEGEEEEQGEEEDGSANADETPPAGPRPSKAGGTFTVRLMQTLAAHPHMSISDLAVAIYGISDASTRGKTRSLLSALKGRGEVDNVGEGAWEVVRKEAMKTKS